MQLIINNILAPEDVAKVVDRISALRFIDGTATAGDIADSAYNPLGRSAKEILDQAEAKVLHIAEQGDRGVQQFADRLAQQRFTLGHTADSGAGTAAS